MNSTAYSPDISLTADQEGLLRTALASNPQGSPRNADKGVNGTDSQQKQSQNKTGARANGSSLYTSPIQNGPNSGSLSNLEDSPIYDDFDDANFDWENSVEQLFGDLPGNDLNEESDLHDKRKASTDSADGDEGASKRQESDGKGPKKPGRKPLTAEPTTKRKAQNRAAQRAFRERKERHLKDLETKVEDLEKASEATNHENGRLRAQVEKLNTELSEYRKRLSLSSTAVGHSPPPTTSRTHHSENGAEFQFAFPKFGDLPGASFLDNGSLAKTSASPQARSPDEISGPVKKDSTSSTRPLSQTTTNESYASPINGISPFQTSTNGSNTFINTNFSDLAGLFSPSVLESASRSNSGDYISFNGGQNATNSAKQGSFSSNYGSSQASKHPRASSLSVTDSPASSTSHVGQNSSYDTTPEPSADSPNNGKASENGLDTINEEHGAHDGSDKMQGGYQGAAYGSSANSIPPMLSASNTPSAFSSSVKSPISDVNGIDWLAQQNGGQFDPVLFGSFRDPHESILNNAFGDDFFADAYNAQDFSTPYNTSFEGLAKGVAATQQCGEGEESVPHMGCNQLLERVQNSTRYQSGEADMDELCSELKTKATCSGSKGVAIDEKDMNAILGPETKMQDDPFKMFS